MLAPAPGDSHLLPMARRARKPARGGGPDRDGDYLAGQVLIAMPNMQDSQFAHAIICLCAHTRDGAMGIVLNKPIANLSFDELLKQLSLEPLPPHRRIRMHDGGPVDGSRGFVLHTADWQSDQSLAITEDLALTASIDILKAIAEGGGPREGILALGYAGWGPGQLEAEIQSNAWLSVPPDEALVFGEEHAAKWRQAMAKLKVDPLLLSAAAGHA
jgi:putative transcriptional regulator